VTLKLRFPFNVIDKVRTDNRKQEVTLQVRVYENRIPYQHFATSSTTQNLLATGTIYLGCNMAVLAHSNRNMNAPQ
jgi:hypothetical protein